LAHFLCCNLSGYFVVCCGQMQIHYGVSAVRYCLFALIIRACASLPAASPGAAFLIQVKDKLLFNMLCNNFGYNINHY